MGNMANWLNELDTRIVTGRPVSTAPFEPPATTPGLERTRETSSGEAPVTTPPITETAPPAATEPPPAATEPPPAVTEPPPAADPVSANLRGWLQQFRSGMNVLSPEMYQLYNGDEILRELQKFDPNARWTPTAQWGGEGGDGPMGYRLDYDVTKLPTVGGPGGGRDVFGWAAVQDGANLIRPEMVYEDPYYGKITPSQNIKKAADPWWTYAAPLAVGVVAPWAAGLAAGAGIGGAAGLTSAVTGSGVAPGATSWWTNAMRGAPSVAKQVASGNFNPAAFAAGVGADALGIPAVLSRPAIGVGSELLSRPRNAGYNPEAFNNAGSQRRPGSNDSALVATEFAADPYGFSKGTA